MPTISVGSVSRPMNPPVKIIDGRPVSFYPASVPVQIDLFTQGRRVEVKPGYTPIVENTAEDDLLGFVSFLNSEYAVNWCHARDIAILVPNTVTDLTDIISRESEAKFLFDFARESCFDVEVCRDQLRILWTAFCLHHGLDVDTLNYDCELQVLWNVISESEPDTADWNDLDSFYGFMCRWLV